MVDEPAPPPLPDINKQVPGSDPPGWENMPGHGNPGPITYPPENITPPDNSNQPPIMDN